ncbi:MAG TPA: universal stress protein [Burkholderiales bacterium]|nr:universal stress protein [Burkholderiales bacterium]
MYRKIMVPVDGSATSQAALKHAVALAKEQKAGVRLVYVLERFQAWGPDGQVDLEGVLRDSGKSVLAEAEAAAAKAGVPVESAIVDAGTQRIARCINDEAAEWKADLIVMGTHGRRGIDLLILGSVAEGVVRTARTPVLLVRSD